LLAANISCNRARAHVSTAKGHAEPTLALLAFQAPRPRQEAGPDPVVCLLHDLRSRARRQQPGAAPHNMSALCCGPLCTGCRPAACCVAPGSLRCRSAALLPCTRCRCCTPRRRRRRRRRPAAPPRPPRVGRDILLVGMNCGLGRAVIYREAVALQRCFVSARVLFWDLFPNILPLDTIISLSGLGQLPLLKGRWVPATSSKTSVLLSVGRRQERAPGRRRAGDEARSSGGRVRVRIGALERAAPWRRGATSRCRACSRPCSSRCRCTPSTMRASRHTPSASTPSTNTAASSTSSTPGHCTPLPAAPRSRMPARASTPWAARERQGGRRVRPRAEHARAAASASQRATTPRARAPGCGGGAHSAAPVCCGVPARAGSTSAPPSTCGRTGGRSFSTGMTT